jgi:hypothetical protein
MDVHELREDRTATVREADKLCMGDNAERTDGIWIQCSNNEWIMFSMAAGRDVSG